eukprot:scaffold258568_cov20-Tisochrysis_lutea.AAC.1
MDCPLQTGHPCFLKRVLGQQSSFTTLFCVASMIVRKVLQANRMLNIISGAKCWTSKASTAFGGAAKE